MATDISTTQGVPDLSGKDVASQAVPAEGGLPSVDQQSSANQPEEASTEPTGMETGTNDIIADSDIAAIDAGGNFIDAGGNVMDDGGITVDAGGMIIDPGTTPAETGGTTNDPAKALDYNDTTEQEMDFEPELAIDPEDGTADENPPEDDENNDDAPTELVPDSDTKPVANPDDAGPEKTESQIPTTGAESVTVNARGDAPEEERVQVDVPLNKEPVNADPASQEPEEVNMATELPQGESVSDFEKRLIEEDRLAIPFQISVPHIGIFAYWDSSISVLVGYLLVDGLHYPTNDGDGNLSYSPNMSDEKGHLKFDLNGEGGASGSISLVKDGGNVFGEYELTAGGQEFKQDRQQLLSLPRTEEDTDLTEADTALITAQLGTDSTASTTQTGTDSNGTAQTGTEATVGTVPVVPQPNSDANLAGTGSTPGTTQNATANVTGSDQAVAGPGTGTTQNATVSAGGSSQAALQPDAGMTPSTTAPAIDTSQTAPSQTEMGAPQSTTAPAAASQQSGVEAAAGATQVGTDSSQSQTGPAP